MIEIPPSRPGFLTRDELAAFVRAFNREIRRLRLQSTRQLNASQFHDSQAYRLNLGTITPAERPNPPQS